MDETKIKFGDKIFIYGKTTDFDSIEELELENLEYNTVMGYMAVGGYYATPNKTDHMEACLPGFVADYIPSLASQTLFSNVEMIDVTSLLSKQTPTLSGTTVWMPIPRVPIY